MRRKESESPFRPPFDDLLHSFKAGVNSFNLDYPEMIRERKLLVARMSPQKRAQFFRAMFGAQLAEAASFYETFKAECIRNMDCIIIPNRLLAYMIKIDNLLDVESLEGTKPFDEPEEIQSYRKMRRQPYLMPPPETEVDFLEALQVPDICCIAYLPGEEHIREMYFSIQNEYEVTHATALGLTTQETWSPTYSTEADPKLRLEPKKGKEDTS